jgi:hypothetical protein
MTPTVLFVADPQEDYVADSLFHGLRTLLGPDAVDYPKRSALYTTYPEDDGRRLYGRGFGLYRLLDDVPVDREGALARARSGGFDAVVFGSIWRDWHWWVSLHDRISPGTALAAVDGADMPWMYPYGPTWWKSPRTWFLPRAHTKAKYFKREWTPTTARMRWLGLPGRVHLHPIAISYPEEKLAASPPAKTQDFQSHIVDPDVAARQPASGTSYAFEREQDYRADLEASRFGVTTKRKGWDALRHYEIAAAGAVPCFRDLGRKPSRCAPHGLVHGVNCLAYSGPEQLFAQVREIQGDRYRALSTGALEWARANTTRRRAEQLLGVFGRAAA